MSLLIETTSSQGSLEKYESAVTTARNKLINQHMIISRLAYNLVRHYLFIGRFVTPRFPAQALFSLGVSAS